MAKNNIAAKVLELRSSSIFITNSDFSKSDILHLSSIGVLVNYGIYHIVGVLNSNRNIVKATDK